MGWLTTVHTALEKALYFNAPPAASMTSQATEHFPDTLWREVSVWSGSGNSTSWNGNSVLRGIDGL